MDISNTSAIASTAAQAQSSADLLAQSLIYSANVGGKDYTADISLSAGQYVATVPDLPGISASGNTLQVAESNLSSRISVLV
jgi:hypothetical protein